MKYSPPIFRSAQGATMLLVMMFSIVGGIALTSWMYLMGARLQQSEHQLDQVTRNIVWSNSAAISQQYALQCSFQDNITQAASTSLLNSAAWGGSAQDAYTSLKAFRSVYTYTNPPPAPGNYGYPFNNIRNMQTPDGSVFYTRTTGASDSSQLEHLSFYSYQKSYPGPLMGDLLYVHSKPTGVIPPAPNTTICGNLLVNGRVLLYDATATVSGVMATELLNLTKTGTNAILGTTGAAMLPDNFPATQRFTCGYGGAGTPNAVLDGSLNIISNVNFTPGSILDIMTNNGGYTNVSAATNSGNGNSAVQVQGNGNTNPYAIPASPSPLYYTYVNPFNVVTVRPVPLDASTLGHLRINGSVDRLIIQGQTTAADWTKADTLPPVIIWLEQEVRDIHLVGENNRRMILVVGTGTGLSLWMNFSGTSLVAGGPLRWRMHLINQYRNIYLDPPVGLNVTITGSIRTNSSINCTDATATTRFTLQGESSPGNLLTLLPRDGWFEPYFMDR